MRLGLHAMSRKSNFRYHAHEKDHISVAGVMLMLVVLTFIIISSGLGLPWDVTQ